MDDSVAIVPQVELPEVADAYDQLVRAGTASLRSIGHSRGGRAMHAATLGSGPMHATLVAGAHAEEPAGPATLRWLVTLLHNPKTAASLLLPSTAGKYAGRPLLDAFTLHIIPHLNPDGEAHGVSHWLDPMPAGDAPFCNDPARFHKRARREAPGEDIEFGWPWTPEELHAQPAAHPVPHIPPTTGNLRVENANAARYFLDNLSHANRGDAPYAFHASLHGMAFSSGAWWLLGRQWTPHFAESPAKGTAQQPAPDTDCGTTSPFDRTIVLRDRLAAASHQALLPLHDVDRQGEKGFRRIGPGFCTTPDVWSMRSYFLSLTPPQPQVAARFRPSSMDFVRTLAEDPLILVTELPLFLLDADSAPDRLKAQVSGRNGDMESFMAQPAPLPGKSRYEEFRNALGASSEPFPDFHIRPLPARQQVRLLLTGLLESLACAAAQSIHTH